ncbi:hypothetical protein BaRGS_00013915 [Batillaria attramentaria]|uniref:Secreted protein n=1 Tax=Batillaria attramentaria TaxID=370345 RepID=A0ABD0L650_9CAEN
MCSSSRCSLTSIASSAFGTVRQPHCQVACRPSITVPHPVCPASQSRANHRPSHIPPCPVQVEEHVPQTVVGLFIRLQLVHVVSWNASTISRALV